MPREPAQTMRLLLLTLLAILTTPANLAAEPLQANRPGETDPPWVVEPGYLQIEGGVQLSRQTQSSPNETTLTVPQLELRLGVVDRLELKVGSGDNGYIHQWKQGAPNESGVSDLVVGTKIFLWNQRSLLPTAGLLLELSIDTGSDEFTSGGLDPIIQTLWLWQMGERYSLNLNLDVASVTKGQGRSERSFQFAPQLAFGVTLTDRLSMFVEYFGLVKDSGLSDEHSMDGGFAYLVTDNLQLDFSVGAGLTGAAEDAFVSTGVAWRLPRLWTPR